ncbi:U6 snRNA-associated Sm-like protein LSm6 [Delitschia confertaspora ATCC 74209]|uniref:U6 snRNA-associated Sm-like protein LSm6 n=1 Tax=Delitschia confertaspora ATCC 74209 TaxID=1513339 RepID=A0A9P4MYZ3_9PLEO|nr:U6 snRNA-associated Sm-like protein LSm6 [Delitschia confertaspora ATCC 74209]
MDSETQNPRSGMGDFIESIRDTTVMVKLYSGAVYYGELQNIDGYMNVSLNECREIRNGKVVRNWGEAFIRGNNVSYIGAGS